MWRFILVTFAFLGWAFYILSGGSDYQPAENSLQVQTRVEPAALPQGGAGKDDAATEQETALSTPKDTQKDAPADAITLEELPETIAGSNEYAEQNVPVQAAVGDPVTGIPAEPGKISDEIEVVTTRVQFDSALQAFAQGGAVRSTETAASPAGEGGIRQVTGNLVNLRSGPGTGFDRVTQLSAGTDVEVLTAQDGWLELRVVGSGETGWIADWLVSAGAN